MQVEFEKLPKYPKIRPDFQAPGPRVLIEKSIKFEDEDEAEAFSIEHNDEVDEVASYEPTRFRYYESQKILGQLYREIDEQQFFDQMQKQSKSAGLGNTSGRSLADVVWKYVRDKTTLIQWDHYIEFARATKDV